MYQLVRYSSLMAREWDEALKVGINCVFLFNRHFMDYHSHRYVDHSIMIKEGDEFVALFPANENDGVIYSHQGLTYGGWIFCKRVTAGNVELLFELMENYYKSKGISVIQYKHKPNVFLSRICETDAWVLWHRGYELWRRDLGFVIDLRNNIGFAKDKHYRLNKSLRKNIRVERNGDIKQFMSLVETNLSEKFQLKPTHTAEEVELLQRNFPENIYTLTVFQEDVFLAGTLLFVDNHFIHTQYLHSNETGKDLCAIEFLIHYLIESFKGDKYYLSFGISTEFEGKVLNSGLATFKEGFGASGICHDFYRKLL